jgi:hypothetical protein
VYLDTIIEYAIHFGGLYEVFIWKRFIKDDLDQPLSKMRSRNHRKSIYDLATMRRLSYKCLYN